MFLTPNFTTTWIPPHGIRQNAISVCHKENRYQDWISGVSTLAIGHSHPALVAAITDQAQKLVHVSQVNLSNIQAQYVQMLFGDFDTIYLCNSGC